MLRDILVLQNILTIIYSSNLKLALLTIYYSKKCGIIDMYKDIRGETYMIVTISSSCTGCGACSAINPEVFEISNIVFILHNISVLSNKD